jgi:hypothetical protein
MMWPRLSKEFSEVACGPSSTSTERTVSSACHAKGVDSWLVGGMQCLLQMSRYLLHHLLDDLGARPVYPCTHPRAARYTTSTYNVCQSHNPAFLKVTRAIPDQSAFSNPCARAARNRSCIRLAIGMGTEAASSAARSNCCP